MDNHPIPQDVTGFQFRLIGDMTVKQFAYVAVGGILAVVFLYAPIPFLFRIPFMIFFGALGATIAFVPFEGRPIDLMLGYFLKAIVTPNQYAYHKIGGKLAIFEYQTQKQIASTQTMPIKKSVNTQAAKEKERKLNSYLSTHHTTTISALDKKEDQFLSRLFTGPSADASQQEVVASPVQTAQSQPQPEPQPEPAPLQVAPPPPIPAPEPVQKADVPLTENQLQEELNKAHLEEDHEQNPEKKALAHTHVAELSAQLEEVQAQKEQLEKELAELRAQAEAAKNESVAVNEPEPPQDVVAEQPPQPAPEPQIEAKIRKVPTEAAKAVGLPYVPEAPNLILGIVKDSRGNSLSNILVEVKDKNGNPARAFRTNALGQFASATQLNDGVYTIEFEDPKGEHKFDSVEIDAKGEIIMPFEVISHDDREELRKALFN